MVDNILVTHYPSAVAYAQPIIKSQSKTANTSSSGWTVSSYPLAPLMLASPEFTPSQPSPFFSSSRLSNWLWSPYKLPLGLNVSFYWHKRNVTLSLLFSFFHSSNNCLPSHCSILPPTVCSSFFPLFFHSLFCLHHYKASPLLGHLFSLFQKDALVSENMSWGHQPLGSTVRELLLKLTFLFGTARV